MDLARGEQTASAERVVLPDDAMFSTEGVFGPDALEPARSPAAAALLADAAAAAAHDEVDRAVELLERAFRASGRAGGRAAISTRLVSLEWRTNPSTRTRNFARLKTALYAGRIPNDELPSVIPHLLWHGFDDDAEQALDQLERGPACVTDATGFDGDRSDSIDRLEFLCQWLKYTHPVHAERHDRMCALPVRAGSGSVHRESAGMLAELFSGGAPDRSAALAQRVLTGHRLTEATVEPLVAAIYCLGYGGRLDRAEAWCEALAAQAQARRAPTWRAIFTGLRAEILVRKGDPVAAARYATLALNQVPAEHLGVWIGTPVAALVRAQTLLGKYSEAEAQLRRPVPRAMFDSRFALPYLRARGQHSLAVGRVSEALRAFRRCGQLMRRWHMDFPWLVPWRNDLAAAYLSAGNPTQVRTFATLHLKQLGTAEDHPSGGVSLRLLAATADRCRRIALLRRAAAIARTGGSDHELATVLGELGRAHRAIGDHEKAWALLREATALAETCGAATLLRDLGGEPDRPPARPPAHAVDTLTPAERRVAELAAVGRRNREIAATLAITPSTVEQHLTRVYRKLAVSRRSELPFALPQSAERGAH
ncbi:LuxR family transcriptional regulator [Nocardia panacis]|uniref:LuxR family transcriptional regulator n=1 Tax=Nocardia panacis TaxID=2340916 RepID=A0A3A4KCF7_9NOCA|nr:LuxR family transcriptional regulator [Nocardia panacis]RJO69972.1 LuxR family transcriptional regulator [Nocardia panacis]